MFSCQIDHLFFNTHHVGDASNWPLVKVASAGHSSRAAVKLFVSVGPEKIRAQFLATGGVVLIACCEYWARQVEASGTLSHDVDQWMSLLDVDPVWRCDVTLVVSAVSSLL